MANELLELKSTEALPASSEERRAGKTIFPKTDILETEENLVLLADIPGVQKDGVEITLERNILSICATVERPEFEDFKMVYSEHPTYDFKRSFALSNEVDQDGINASVKNGVLKLVLPKSSNVLPKKISVQTE